MDDSKAKILFSISEWKIEISGSEEFVIKQIEKFNDYLDSSAKLITSWKLIISKEQKWNTNTEKSIEISNSSNVSNNWELSIWEEYPNVFHINDDDKIKIICDIKGTTNAAKTYDIAMMYAFAKDSEWWALVEDIRTICTEHACHDSKNFSTYIKKWNPKNYSDNSSGKSRKIKLTYPWKKEAEKIIKKYNISDEEK